MIRISTVTAALALFAASMTLPRATAQPLGLDEATATSVVERMLPTLRTRAGVVLYPPIDVRFVSRDALRTALESEWTAILTGPHNTGDVSFDETRAASTAAAIASALAPNFAVRYVAGPDGSLLFVPENAAIVRGKTTRETRRRVEAAIARELARSAETKAPPPTTFDELVARHALEEAVASWAGMRVTRRRAEPRMATNRTHDAAGHLADAIVGKARVNAIRYVDRIAAKDATREQLLALRPTSVAAFDTQSAQTPVASAVTQALRALATLLVDEGWTHTDEPRDQRTVAKALAPALGASNAKRLTRGLVHGTRRSATHPAHGSAHFTILEMNNPSSAYAWLVAQRKVVAERDTRLGDGDVTVERAPTRTIAHDAFPVLEETRTTIRAADQQTTAVRLTGVCRDYCFEVVTTETLPASRRRAFLDALATHLAPKGLPRR